MKRFLIVAVSLVVVGVAFASSDVRMVKTEATSTEVAAMTAIHTILHGTASYTNKLSQIDRVYHDYTGPQSDILDQIHTIRHNSQSSAGKVSIIHGLVDDYFVPPPTTTTTIAPTTTTVAPTTTTTVPPTTTTTVPPTTTTAPVVDYPAEPPIGMLLWGAAVDNNTVPTVHEDACSCVMGLRRTFWQWSHRTTSIVTTASGDLAAGRVPWVSIKTPPWPEMGAGTHDAGIDAMLNALEALNGPVWLTVHHEPEGGGAGGNVPDDPSGPTGWLSMQTRVRQRMTALNIDDVALVPILMTYTWNPASGRNPEQWWTPGIFDFLGVDHYVHTETTLLDPIWQKVRDFAAAKGVDVAAGEWGMRGTNAIAGDRVRAWYTAAANSHNDGNGARVIGLAAFDSNPVGQDPAVNYWKLAGDQLTAFRQLLVDPRTYLIGGS